MKSSTIRILLVVCAASLLSACPTTPRSHPSTLIRLDKEAAALEQKPRSPATAGGFAQLSASAEMSGDSVSAADPATAASFYRIAATNAWRAGPPRDSAVVSLRDKGAAVCAKIAADEASQPRDCAVIRMVPELAVLGQETAKAQAMLDAGATLDGANLVQAGDIVSTMNKSIQRVLRERPAPAAQSKSFDDYVAGNLNNAYCTLLGLVGLPSSSPPEKLKPLTSSVTATRQALQEESLPTQCRVEQ